MKRLEYKTGNMSAEGKACLVEDLTDLLQHYDGDDLEYTSLQLRPAMEKTPIDYVQEAISFLEDSTSGDSPRVLDLPSMPNAWRKPKSDTPGSNTSKDSKKSEASAESGSSTESRSHAEQSTGSKENQKATGMVGQLGPHSVSMMLGNMQI